MADSDDRNIVEPVPMLPVYVTGVGPVSVRNGLVFMAMTAEQCRVDGDGLERVLVARIIMPVDLMRTTSTKVTDIVLTALDAQRRGAS